MLPLSETERNTPRSKAAKVPRNQECAASARDPKKHATVKGSKYPENVLPLPETRRNMPRSKAANIPRNQECAASARDPKKHASVKGSKYPEKSRKCCLCQRPEGAHLGQRQQKSREIKKVLPLPETRRNSPRSKAANIPRNQENVAFAGDPKKRASVKGIKCPKKSRKCCLCQRPEETCLVQRQQISREIKNVLPLPETRRNAPRSKAANVPRNQESAASA